MELLDSVNHALRFVQRERLTEEDTSVHMRWSKNGYRGGKSTLCKKKRLHQQENLEEFSSKSMSLNECTAVVESESVWRQLAEVTQRMRKGDEVTR